MPATWGDFIHVGSTSGSGEGTLSVSNVQKNDIIIAVSTARRQSGPGVAPPVHTPGGISTDLIHEQNTIPAEIYPLQGWVWWWYPWWRYWWPYWYPNPWLRYVYRTISRVSIYQASDNGTVTVTFSRGYTYSPIIQTHLSVWRPNVTVGANETLKSITFATSAQTSQYLNYMSSMPVKAHELLLATAKGINVPALSPALTGVSVQTLLNYSAVYGASRETVQLWRVKTDGTATLVAANANISQQLTKIVPNVEIGHVSVPTIPPDATYFYAEIAADLLSTGRVIRPRWFENIRSAYAWSNSLGLRKRWVKGTSLSDERGRARLIELWKLPKGAESYIPSGEAYVFTTDADAESRVLFHDLGW